MSAESEGKARASQFRIEHDLGTQPLTDLVALIETVQGVDVAVLDAGPDEHGMTMHDPDRGVVVVAVARTENSMRQRSSLAHELAHLVFGDYQHPVARGGWSHRTHDEMRADAFARHLLVPVDALGSFVGGGATESDLSELVQRFEASPAIVAIQLRAVRAISEQTKTAWMSLSAPTLATRHGWTDQYRALQAVSNGRRAPQRLLMRATAGYVAGVLSLQAIARLRGAPEETIEKDFAEAGITPEHHDVEWSPGSDLAQVPVDLSDLG
jgi:Zn-dependent peptidase ImmA (M78 family)